MPITGIYGKIINIGWVPQPQGFFGNGRIMVIANMRGRGIYLLAHLHADTETLRLRGMTIQRGLLIEPNDIVALVGASGGTRNENRFEPHLHVEYYDVQYREEDDVSEDNNRYVRVHNGENAATRWLELQQPLTVRGRTPQNSAGRINRRNPFAHEEEFILPHTI